MTAHDLLLGNTKGTAGINGKDVEFIIDGDRIGLRLKGDLDYTYTDNLTGHTGEKGERGYTFIPFIDVREEEGKILLSWINNGDLSNPETVNILGPQGPEGEGLDFQWRGTELGIKKKSDTEYTYVDLQGPGVSQTEINSLLENIQLKNIFKIVDSLPSENEGDENKIYLRSKSGGTPSSGGSTVSFALQSDLNSTNDALQELIENTYTKSETNVLTNIITVVNTLPETGETHSLYFIPKGEGEYDIYSYVNNVWVQINPETNLSEFSADVEDLIDEKLSQRDYNVVNELPETGLENTLYFVKTN